MAGITFETVLLGLERASTMREVQYTNFASNMTALEQERAHLEAAASTLQNVSAEAGARVNLEQISA
ncbi:hypothetical protein AB4144_65505, partial [Rhizobiaceae sp. 2RAB30]